jgi:hypothetical protein
VATDDEGRVVRHPIEQDAINPKRTGYTSGMAWFEGAIAMPDLKRALKNACLTTSTEAREAYDKGDVKGVQKIAKASYLSRAHELAGVFPPLSQYFHHYAKSLGEDATFTKDNMYRLSGGIDDAPTVHKIEDEITELNFRTLYADVNPVGDCNFYFWAQKLGHNWTTDSMKLVSELCTAEFDDFRSYDDVVARLCETSLK